MPHRQLPPMPGQRQRQSQGSLLLDGGAAPAGAAAQMLAIRVLPADSGVWDELRQAAALRPVWQRFATHLPPPAGAREMAPDMAPDRAPDMATDMAPDMAPDMATELDRRLAQVQQRIRLDGVTHNVFSDAPRGGTASRPWSLELLPLLIEPADWAFISAGVKQRAELLERMLADLYGDGPHSQRLLHEGLLPPALLLRHPGWLRPMVGVQPAGGQRLMVVAFDLARAPDGRWWLVSQRTQGPSGLGYVLHNRLVIARQFPDAFRELNVQRIASSYRRLLQSIEERAAHLAGGHTPRVVLLTPGPYSETYFEHAYLARYLGLPLVEGGDLTVRSERLYLKTVEGLEPVHGLLRRLDDDWCDPLELRPDSALGVPGLLQAARAGHVVMANALGSAFLESPAIQGFLPAIARRLTGESLQLPALPTWWCGESAAWVDVRERLDDKALRSTFPRRGRTSKLHDPRTALVQEDPDAWTVQGRLRFSRAPIWGQGVVTPRPALLRVYAVAEGDGRWHVLPGGMTRVAQREDASVSMQRGGTSLDTWVLTDGPVDRFSLLPQRLQVDDIQKRRSPVSSRTGENLFWLGRYTERTEQLVRLAQHTLLLIDTDAEAPPPLRQALSLLAVRTGLAPHGVPTLVQSARHFERAVLAALADSQGVSIAYNMAALERAASGLRERLSSEQWRLVRSMGDDFTRALAVPDGQLPTPAQALPALDRLALQLAAVTGAQTDRMTRDHGWRLLTVGRLIERLQGVALRLELFIQAQALASVAGVEMLLELFDSLITFRARYQRHDDLLALADLLVLDSDNPRAFAGVLRRLRTELSKLPAVSTSINTAVDTAVDTTIHAAASTAQPLQSLAALLPATGAGLTLESLRGADDTALAATLQALAAELGSAAATLADRVSERYFTLAHGSDQRV
ncbi:MAG: circularly permuted type 2 ATP-grasp protein [Rubrivivax sp.]|nr:circularly permuted type 2 ATP-grasp protein [Rubrivivax sp.]